MERGIHARVVRVDSHRHRALVVAERRHLGNERLPERANRRRGGDVTNQLSRSAQIAEPGEQPDGYAHAILYAFSRAAASSGSAVAPSSQTAPSSKNSCFHTGTICFTRSMA